MLPTVAPALRANFDPTEFDTRDQARAHARAGLVAPAGAAAGFAIALCEVEAGVRPAGQLERACHHTLYAKLAERVRRPPAPATSRAPDRSASRHGHLTARGAAARCGSTLGGREALKHACDLPRGHEGRCSWWEWHQERVARHEHTRRWRHHLSPPPFRLADYQDFLAERLAHAPNRGHAARPAPAVRPPERSQQRGGGGHER